ncbi:MAG: sigma-70 family RNA polymerase sigma factor [Ginsengibacter sp.]
MLTFKQHISPEIWEACKKGDKFSYAIIYRVYFPKLYNYGKKFTDNVEQIEDCIQDIFTNFWFNRQKLLHVKEIQTYLFISFRNNLLKILSRTKNHSSIDTSSEMYGFKTDLSIDHIMISTEEMYEQRINFENVIKKLTPRQREAIFFKFYENMSYENISIILGITTKGAYKLIARAITELRSAYKEKMV